MDVFLIALLVAGGMHLLKSRYQAGRVALLGSYLAPFQLEKLMENLTQGYLRALGEADTERRAQIWALLTSTETGNSASNWLAISRGFRFSALASCIARLVAKSPCVGSRGRSR